jgi:hypothetical protein
MGFGGGSDLNAYSDFDLSQAINHQNRLERALRQ